MWDSLSVLALPPLVVWGVVHRLVALLLFVATAQWYWQAPLFFGRRGLNPVANRFRKLARDYPPLLRVCLFPSLFWVCARDWFIKLVVVVGAAAALLTAAGCVPSAPGMLLAWVCYVSISDAASASFPWDDMILETSFLCLLLPSLPAVWGGVSASAVPLPVVAFAFRWLGFRVILGFGKMKFWGTTADDWDYLRGFYVNIPLPSLLSWASHFAPDWFLKLSLAGMFLIECVLPFGFLLPAPWRGLASVACIKLMVLIHLSGNWGHFNILTAIVSATGLDATAACWPGVTASATGSVWTASATELCVYFGYMLFLFPLTLLAFTANSWANRSAWWLDGLQGVPLVTLLRWVFPFRIVHSYGIFVPQSFPPLKLTPVFEGSMDGVNWKPYLYKYQICCDESKPPHVAPYHPRFDMLMFYQGPGMDWSLLAEGKDPYYTTTPSVCHRVAYLLLSDVTCEHPVTRAFGTNPFLASGHPPKFVRVQMRMFLPQWKASLPKSYWRGRDVGTHMPAVSLSSPALANTRQFFGYESGQDQSCPRCSTPRWPCGGSTPLACKPWCGSTCAQVVI